MARSGTRKVLFCAPQSASPDRERLRCARLSCSEGGESDGLFVHRKEAHSQELRQASGILDVPYLLAIQIESYRQFLQADVERSERANVGLHAAFKTVFPITSYSGNATLEYVSYRLGEPAFDVKECQLRGLTYAAPLRVLVRLIVLRQGSPGRQEARQGHPRAGGLHGRTAAHDRQRHLRRSTAPSASSSRSCTARRACSSTTTRARPTRRASCCSRRA